MKNNFLLFLFLISFQQIVASEQNFSHIGAAEGLSQISVMSIYQDEIGYMWFGTRAGLNRYDGNSIEVFRPTEDSSIGIPHNIINAITGDKRGRLYFISDYKHLVYYDLKKDVFSILEDDCLVVQQGNNRVWYTVSNQIKYIDSENKIILHATLPSSINNITCLLESSWGELFIGTSSGLFRLDKNKHLKAILLNENITTLFEDSKQNIWSGTNDNGVISLDKHGVVNQKTCQQADCKLSSKIIRTINEDNLGQLWIGTFNGLNRLNPETGEIKIFSGNDPKPGKLSHSSIYSLFKDRMGTIWIGSYYGGVNYFNPEINIFSYYFPDKYGNTSVNYPIIGKMAEDGEQNIWICTEGGGLNRYNQDTGIFTYFTADKPNSISHNNVKCILYNKENKKLYIGTHTGGLDIYDTKTKKFHNISTKTDPKLKNDVIVSLQQHNNQLIISTQGGTVSLNMATEALTNFDIKDNNNIILNQRVTVDLIDSKNNLWFDFFSETIRYNLATKTIKRFYHTGKTGDLGRQYENVIYEDRRGRIFLGSNGSGLFMYQAASETFKRFSVEENNLLSNYIYDINETDQGYLILLTNHGVNLFDPDSGSSKFYDREHGFPLEMSNFNNGILKARNGEIFVGSINGLTTFVEDKVESSPKEYKLFFSELYINGEKIKPKNKQKIKVLTLPYTDKITLNYRQNDIAVSFASSNLIKANRPAFQHKLDGIDNEWHETTQALIRYNNLHPGNYTLMIREKPSPENKNSNKLIQLKLKIKPPFYASYLAYFIYALILGFLLWKIIQFNYNRLQLRTSLAYEKRENERIKELNQTKLQFFTNISHEFRTPLTLIIGQIESMLQSSSLAPMIQNKLGSVYKNADHLRSLISELLDFRKQEQGMLELKVSQQNIVPFVENIFNSFSHMAEKRGIDYRFQANPNEILLWFDPAQLQKVISNLLSNAFKYSDDEGQINVNLTSNDKDLILAVSDTGIGIPKKDTEKVFERFYQSSASTQRQSGEQLFSTGIGLALTKSIVELHHGEISVASNNKQGSVFTVRLPLGDAQFSEHQKSRLHKELSDRIITDEMLPDKQFVETISSDLRNENLPAPTILIVEDNEEMLQFLYEIFNAIYKVETASDGIMALEKLKDMQPDIILSDVMMPNMSGKELCSRIKSNFDTSHIPFVLLTAQASEDQNIEGLMLGADDYITKPFNVKMLISRCNNLVIGRKRLQECFIREADSLPETLATNIVDQELIDRAHRIVMEHIKNPAFDVTQFASEMALGKSKLYLKIKGISGMTPNEFIQNIRLKTAASTLLDSPEKNISEVAYELGFNSPRYFSQCFKELFGTTPLNYRKEKNVN